jgi:hypothetical protein
MQITHNARIFFALLSRDIKLLSTHILSMFIDCIFPLTTQVLTFGYLFPLLGMPSSMIAPIYLGSMLSLFLQMGFTTVMKVAFDLNNNRFIDYQITLPISKRWLFASYITHHMIELALITIPLYVIGILILHNNFDMAQASVCGIICMALLIFVFFATFFNAIAFSFPLQWILENTWPRILVPLWWMSSGLVIWKLVHAWWPLLSYIMLLSPFTYIAEGLRSSLLGNEKFIAWQWCALALVGFIIINIFALKRGVKKRLDPV